MADPHPLHPGSRGTGVVEFLSPEIRDNLVLRHSDPWLASGHCVERGALGSGGTGLLSVAGPFRTVVFPEGVRGGASRLLPSGPAGCWMASYAFFGQEIRRLQAKPLASAFSSF